MTSTLPGYPGGLTNYNANDQISTDTYDNDGNTTGSNGVGYVYDFENRLVQAGGGISIVYDGDGNRVSKTVAGLTTTYVVDTANPTGYAQVVYESITGSNGTARELNHTFVYGLQEGPVLEQRQYFTGTQTLTLTQTIYFVYDGHGSVRALTDQTGAVTDTYDYDAFGNLLHSTGTTLNNYRFAGEQFDPDLNLYFNRARYLNVSTGRFLTADSLEADPETPLALHKYLYAEGNPIGHVDPSGHFSTAEIILGASIVITLALAAVLHFTVHPARIGLYWKNRFTWHNYLGGKSDPTAQLDVAAIKQNALDTLARAFGPYGASVFEGIAAGSGGHTIEVDDVLSANGCGQTRTSPSNYSWIDYSCILSHAEFVLGSNNPTIVSPAVGRGAGNIGAHEVGHQLALTAVKSDRDLPGYYDGGNSSDPTCYDGTGQVWTEQSKQELPGKIKPFF
jgi:RHS repeat-associated protein